MAYKIHGKNPCYKSMSEKKNIRPWWRLICPAASARAAARTMPRCPSRGPSAAPAAPRLDAWDAWSEAKRGQKRPSSPREKGVKNGSWAKFSSKILELNYDWTMENEEVIMKLEELATSFMRSEQWKIVVLTMLINNTKELIKLLVGSLEDFFAICVLTSRPAGDGKPGNARAFNQWHQVSKKKWRELFQNVCSMMLSTSFPRFQLFHLFTGVLYIWL